MGIYGNKAIQGRYTKMKKIIFILATVIGIICGTIYFTALFYKKTTHPIISILMWVCLSIQIWYVFFSKDEEEE